MLMTFDNVFQESDLANGSEDNMELRLKHQDSGSLNPGFVRFGFAL